MELYQLRTFLKVADEGNLSRAAEKLFISQPAISGQIKALEEEFELSLFVRSAKGMHLTEAGKRLYQQAQETVSQADSMSQMARSLKVDVAGEVRIGVNTDFEYVRVSELLIRAKQKYPHLVVHFLECATTHLVNEIRQGRLDMGFLFGPCLREDMEVIHLTQTPMAIVGPWEWRDQIQNRPLEQLGHFPWLYSSEDCPFYQLTEEMLQKAHIQANILAHIDSEDAVRTLVKSGAGLAVLREDDGKALEKRGEACCWGGPVPAVGFNLVVPKSRLQEAPIRAFIDEICQLWADETTIEG